MELMKREFLTVTDDGDDICMTLDTAHKTVQEIGRKMAEIRSGLLMDGKGWEAFLKYYLDGNNPALLKDLNCKGDFSWEVHNDSFWRSRGQGALLCDQRRGRLY